MVDTVFEKFSTELKKSLDYVKTLYDFALKNNYHNTLEFINWQDILNVYSLLPEDTAIVFDDVKDGDPVDQQGDTASL